MNWRRGAVLAIVNVLVVIGAIVQIEFAQKRFSKQPISKNRAIAIHSVTEDNRQSTGEVTFGLDPCTMTDRIAPPAEPAIFGNLPASTLTGWGDDCVPDWSIAARLEAREISWPISSNVRLQRKLDACMLLLVGVQWLLLGSLPTLAHRSWWREPGAFITVCASVGVVLVAIPWTRAFGRLTAAVAALIWLLWLVLAAVALIRKLWFRGRTSSISV